mmetsp:Transcript_1378/g.2461  ORF Transcript_1378/g.2461 Transcript_1378/m.2461 type:complete len:948 (+) Transcript_1378:52-2895(+)
MKIQTEAISSIAMASFRISSKSSTAFRQQRNLLMGSSGGGVVVGFSAARSDVSTYQLRFAPAVDVLLSSNDANILSSTSNRRLDNTFNSNNNSNNNHSDKSPLTCDATFLTCILSSTCLSCFNTLQENDIDWTNVVPDTPCQDVLGFLVASGHCQEVRDGGEDERDTFCNAFDACVIWDEDDDFFGKMGEGGTDDEMEGEVDNLNFMDCSKLTECKWEGMHEHFLGDGVCHDAMPGCYNSKVCGYDGGDCCQDTCKYPTQSGVDYKYGECGMEGYACRDPKSEHCQPILARMYQEFCEKEQDEGSDADMFDDDALFGPTEKEKLPECSSSQSVYRLIEYDSWGDGWDSTVLTLRERDGSSDSTLDPIYQGGLEYGSQGTVHLCLTKNQPKCYHIQVENGVWGNEISWELRPLAGGAPVLAAGGSPSDCTVPLGGTIDGCPNTCDSTRPDTNINDPNYKSYKDMEACIEQKCIIQVGSCAQDPSCSECMQNESPDFCFANENFNALIDCSMCSCTENRPLYCDSKGSSASKSGSSAAASGSTAATHEGNTKPVPGSGTAGSPTGGSAVCGPEQTLKGTKSLVTFAECADVDQMLAMVTDFDNDNFGALDLFEECAHIYNTEPMHGGKNALDCMKILYNIIIEDDEEGGETKKNIGKDSKGGELPEKIAMAVSTLAEHLYHDAESFCECSSDVNKITPMCSSFINFKTLLYEAVDACMSLDVIDCAAWEEFYTPCKQNLIQMFDTVDFENHAQCEYVENMCGGAGPFPAFRRLDCGGEIAKPAWDFHTMYSRSCLKSQSDTPPTPTPPSPPPPVPKPTPVKPATPSNVAPSGESHYKPYTPKQEEKKPYYSPASNDFEPAAAPKYATEEKTTHHYFRNTFIIFFVTCIAGITWYRKRRENFNYLRFRQLRAARNYGGGSAHGGDYTGISMEDSCSFEPPSLPPTPSTMI